MLLTFPLHQVSQELHFFIGEIFWKLLSIIDVYDDKINHKILVKYYAIFSLDYDECQSNSSNNCEQICVNIPTSFFCECRDGYSLNEDGRSCDGKTFVFKLRKLYGKIRGEFLALSFNVELDQDNEIVVHFSFFRWRHTSYLSTQHFLSNLRMKYQKKVPNLKLKLSFLALVQRKVHS